MGQTKGNKETPRKGEKGRRQKEEAEAGGSVLCEGADRISR